MSGSHIPVQYMSGPNLRACLVIYNTQEDKDVVEVILQKLLGVTKGKLSFGPPGNASESLAYNQGWCDGMGVVTPNSKIVYTPDVADADTGEILIRGVGKKNKRIGE
jgi:hypothetical protein